VIDVSDTARQLVETPRSWVLHTRVESWLGDQLLAASVPIERGREDVDLASRVPERLTMTVPRRRDGVDWSPGDDAEHPLAANGQRLRVSLGIELVTGDVEWLQRGEYAITRSEPFGDSVMVEAGGLLLLIDEARLVSPFQPAGTLESTVRGLVEPALTVLISADLVNRAVPAGINFDEDRLGALLEVLTAWPARARMTPEGFLAVDPDTEPTGADLTITGALTERLSGESTRADGYNCVVARGTAADGAQLQGVAYDYGTGPRRFGGPFNPLPVPFFFPSPLLTTVTQARLAAATRLARLQREQRAPLVAESTPLPHVVAGDPVLASGEGLSERLCTIEALSTPLTAADGPSRLTMVPVTS
jgi:hypothetical protein